MPHPIWQEALTGLFQRYLDLSGQHRTALAERLGGALVERTEGLCRYAVAHLCQGNIAEDKANRWLGFVQGVLIAGKVITIEGERDYTRPIFHALKGASPSHDARDGQPTG